MTGIEVEVTDVHKAPSVRGTVQRDELGVGILLTGRPGILVFWLEVGLFDSLATYMLGRPWKMQVHGPWATSGFAGMGGPTWRKVERQGCAGRLCPEFVSESWETMPRLMWPRCRVTVEGVGKKGPEGGGRELYLSTKTSLC